MKLYIYNFQTPAFIDVYQSACKFEVVWGTRSSMLDWVLDAGLSCTKGVWYIYDRDTV